MNPPKKLLWLDLETTGLVAGACVILEAAWAFAEFHNPFQLITDVRKMVLHLPESYPLSTFIQEMHTNSGLLAECYVSDKSATDLEEALLADIPEIADKEERWIIAGSTIHFDLGFLRVHCPQAAKRLSHRCYDVSAMKLLGESLGMAKFPKAEAHRSEADIYESIAHGSMVANWLRAPGVMVQREEDPPASSDPNWGEWIRGT